MLTLCVSTYNRSGFLDEMLASFDAEIKRVPGVLTEVVVLLNACTDDSQTVALKWQQRLSASGVKTQIALNDPALYVLDSYTKAIRLATNRYVWLFGDDDIVLQGALKNIRSALEANPDVGVVAMNWQSVETDLSSTIAGPRIPSGTGRRYETFFDFARSCGLMPLSFLSAIVLRAGDYLDTRTIRESLYVDTTYHHLCALIEAFSRSPVFVVEPVAVHARLNYRLDQFDRKPKPLAPQIKASLEAGLALVAAFQDVGCPPDLLREHKKQNTNNLRTAFFIVLLHSSLRPADWVPLRARLAATYSESPVVRGALRLAWIFPSPVIKMFSRDRLRLVHRGIERLKLLLSS